MRDEDRVRILHMLDAAEAVAQFLDGRSSDAPRKRYILVMDSSRATRKPLQLGVRHDLEESRELDINASKTRERWLTENREAIEAYNDLVARHDVFSEGLRGF
jgi:hypothetical protein